MLFALVRPVEPSLEELAAAAVGGDGISRRELARRALARILRVAGRVGARGADAEAIALETLQDAFGALATFRGETPFYTWLDAATARALLRRDGAHRRRDVDRVLRAMAAEDDDDDTDDEGADAGASDATVDDLTARRLERAAIAALDHAPAAAPVPVARHGRWVWAAFGAIAAACAGLIALAAVWPHERRAAPRLDAVVAHASGGATIAGARARAGRWVGAGADFEVPPGGKLALGLGDGTVVRFAEGARGVVDAWTVEDARLRLDAGTLLVRASGRGRGLEVETRALVVRAAAAVVAVTADQPSSVRVLRGRALIEDRAGKTRTVTAGRTGAAGSAGATTPAQAAADWVLAGRRTLQVHGARVSIETTPPGARAELDGEDLGVTPLSLLARPGTGHLSITLAGHGPIREEVDLSAGQTVSRRFELVPVAPH